MAISPGGRPADDSPLGTRKNWVTKAGGLPPYMREVAHALIRAGHPESEAIEMAEAAMERFTHSKNAGVAAAATKALARWEAMKASAGVNLANPVAPSKVHGQLSGDYPDKVLSWVKQARFVRKQVPLASIRMHSRPGKPHDAAKVAGITQAIRSGKPMKPVVLVDKGDPKLTIADGYHRTRAFASAGHKTVDAVVATGLGDGPWDREMHDKKLNLSQEAPMDAQVIELARKQKLPAVAAKLHGHAKQHRTRAIRMYKAGNITGARKAWATAKKIDQMAKGTK